MNNPLTADTWSYIKTQRDVSYKHRSSHVIRLSWNKSNLVHILGNSKQAGGGSSSKLRWCHRLNRFSSGLTQNYCTFTSNHTKSCKLLQFILDERVQNCICITQITHCSKSGVSESETPNLRYIIVFYYYYSFTLPINKIYLLHATGTWTICWKIWENEQRLLPNQVLLI